MLSLHAQEQQTGNQMAAEACGFITIVIGTFLLHATRELDVSSWCALLHDGSALRLIRQVLGELSHCQEGCPHCAIHGMYAVR